MSSYTMQLREFIEQATQDNQELPLDEVIEAGRKQLFDFDYPIFDPYYKKVFETNFIQNFYMREIGFETEALFKFRLKNWLNINMPYFNQLYTSEKLEFDPLKNTILDESHSTKKTMNKNDSRETDVTSNIKGSGDSNSSQNSNTSTTGNSDISENVKDDNFNRHLESDTPESRLGITATDGQGVIEYASKIEENNVNNQRDISKNETLSNDSTTNDTATNHTTTNQDATGNTKDTFTSDITNNEDYAKHIFGKVGTQSYSKMVMEFRETFMRIDKRIFNEMQVLFMLVY